MMRYTWCFDRKPRRAWQEKAQLLVILSGYRISRMVYGSTFIVLVGKIYGSTGVIPILLEL